MRRRPPRATRTDTLVPYTTLFRSPDPEVFVVRHIRPGMRDKLTGGEMSRPLRRPAGECVAPVQPWKIRRAPDFVMHRKHRLHQSARIATYGLGLAMRAADAPQRQPSGTPDHARPTPHPTIAIPRIRHAPM